MGLRKSALWPAGRQASRQAGRQATHVHQHPVCADAGLAAVAVAAAHHVAGRLLYVCASTAPGQQQHSARAAVPRAGWQTACGEGAASPKRTPLLPQTHATPRERRTHNKHPPPPPHHQTHRHPPASSNTMKGALPPSSRDTRFTVEAAPCKHPWGVECWGTHTGADEKGRAVGRHT